MRTTSVIVAYRSKKTIERAVGPLHDACAQGQHACVVVDNYGADGTVEHVTQTYPHARAFYAGGNLGFGRGCNLGAKDCETEFVLFLNPDASLPFAELEKLERFMDEHPAAGIIAPAIVDCSQCAGLATRPIDVLYEAWGAPSHPNRRFIVPGEAPFRTNWVCGAAMLVRTKLFRALGGFDPRFFLYFEETDLCQRALEAGSEIWVVPSVSCWHEAGVSAREGEEATLSGDVARHYFQSRFYYLSKHYGVASAVLADLLELPPMLARAVLGNSVRRKTLRTRLAASLLRPPPEHDGKT